VETLSIGQLAREAGVHIETIRYYERRGLLPEPPRSEAGYRQYSASDVWRLQFIGRAKRLGFTLNEIAELVGEHDQRSADRVVDAAQRKVADLGVEIEELVQTQERLRGLIGMCEGGNVDDCLALQALS
jgi:MerR family copper efflux transcriptional regulator